MERKIIMIIAIFQFISFFANFSSFPALNLTTSLYIAAEQRSPTLLCTSLITMILLGLSILFSSVSGQGVLNVVRFPNDACTSNNNFNGTCYTASECSSLGGSSSGSCATGFGVCCVFSLSCGGRTNANTSYAIINSFSTSTDRDPCTYTYCRCSEDVCKLRSGTV